VTMDLRLLTSFRAVVDQGSVSAAAAVLMVGQPALSRQIQQLEREIGVRLFVREKGRLRLTAAGRTFLESVDEVLTAAENARSLAVSLAMGRLERVRMVAPTTTLTDVLAPFLATLQPSDPLITVTEAQYAQAIRELGSRADLAIVTSPPPRNLRSERVAVLPIWAYVPRDHPCAAAGELSVSDLAQHPLVLLDSTFRPRTLLDEALVVAGQAPPEIVECSHPQVAQALAAAGRGVAVVSDDPRFGLVPLRITTERRHLEITLHAAWDPHHHAAAKLGELVDRLADFVTTLYGPRTL